MAPTSDGAGTNDHVRVRAALLAIVERFEDNDDPRDWPAEIREAQTLLRELGRRA